MEIIVQAHMFDLFEKNDEGKIPAVLYTCMATFLNTCLSRSLLVLYLPLPILGDI